MIPVLALTEKFDSVRPAELRDEGARAAQQVLRLYDDEVT